MDKAFKAVVVSVGVATSYIVGEWWPLIVILIGLMGVDVISGMAAAAIEARRGQGEGLSSQRGYERGPRKVLTLCMVAACALGDLVLRFAVPGMGERHMLLGAATIYYSSFELLSIIENAGRAGLPVPPVVRDVVAVLRSKGEVRRDTGVGSGG